MSNKNINTMHEENKKKSALLPRLRFPEFKRSEEWKLEPLGKLAKRRTAKNTKGDHTRVLTNSAEFGVIDQRDYFEKDIATQGNLEGYYIVEKGDYVYNPRVSTSAPVGPISKNNVGTGVMSPLYTVFRFDNSSNDFYAHYLKSTHWHQYMRQASSTGARHDRMSITNDDFMGLPLPVSKPEEQQKIADCLSSLDELIAAETQKLEVIKTHKKGLMQQLFPREGETVPRLRFPEFLEVGEWEEKVIEDFFDVGSSKRVLQDDWTTQGVPFYRTRELVSLSKNESFGSEIFISEELFREISVKYGLPAEGDFLVSGVGTLGVSYQVKAQDRFYFKDGNVLWFKMKGGIISTFFKYCFEADEIQNQISTQASISTVGTYTIQNAKVTKFSCPTNIEEQQKIADFLSSLDGLITAQSQKIDALKTHKKGLMQQLFPVLDEVLP